MPCCVLTLGFTWWARYPTAAARSASAPRSGPGARSASVLRCWRSRDSWKVQTAEFPEIPGAIPAVAHARAAPAVREDAIHLVEGHDLLDDAGHELEVVRAE